MEQFKQWASRTLLNWRWWACLPIVLPGMAISFVLAMNKRLWRLPYLAASNASIGFELFCRPHIKRLYRWAFR